MRIRVPGLSRPRSTEARAASTLEPADVQVPLERRTDTITLIYELLDAHQDTAELAGQRCDDVIWAAHLDYLRALQRTGREMLARMPVDEDRR